MLTWMAAQHRPDRGLSRVLGVPYRKPAMVAKMAETLDRLSGGRLILGLGGGSADDEFRAFGMPRALAPRQDRRARRGDRDDPGAVDVAGAYVRRPDLPHPGGDRWSRKPSRPIPIWVGTFGPRALAVTGRLADGWIPSLGHAPPEAIPAMRDRIATAAAAAGRYIDDITLRIPRRGEDRRAGAGSVDDHRFG